MIRIKEQRLARGKQNVYLTNGEEVSSTKMASFILFPFSQTSSSLKNTKPLQIYFWTVAEQKPKIRRTKHSHRALSYQPWLEGSLQSVSYSFESLPLGLEKNLNGESIWHICFTSYTLIYSYLSNLFWTLDEIVGKNVKKPFCNFSISVTNSTAFLSKFLPKTSKEEDSQVWDGWS